MNLPEHDIQSGKRAPNKIYAGFMPRRGKFMEKLTAEPFRELSSEEPERHLNQILSRLAHAEKNRAAASASGRIFRQAQSGVWFGIVKSQSGP